MHHGAACAVAAGCQAGAADAAHGHYAAANERFQLAADHVIGPVAARHVFGFERLMYVADNLEGSGLGHR